VSLAFWDNVEFAASIAFLLGVGVALLAMVTARAAAGQRGGSGQDTALTDGAVMILDGSQILRWNTGAADLLGVGAGGNVDRQLDELLGVNARAVRDSLETLHHSGRQFRLLVRDAAGTPYEVHGHPLGGLARLVLRDVSFAVDQAKAEAGWGEPERARSDPPAQSHPLAPLISERLLIVWRRDAEGEITTLDGGVRTAMGEVTAEQLRPMIGQQSSEPQRAQNRSSGQRQSRIEIPVGEADPIPLHLSEIDHPDGGQIGFAVDASVAAGAERTLTRFVQTMTETFAHLTVGLAIFDQNQTLGLFNPALVELWQLEPAWLARRPSLREILDRLRAIRRIPDVKDYHAWRTRLMRLFEDTEIADFEELWNLADGTTIRVLARPHPHGSVALIFDDVTERIRLEQNYRHMGDLTRSTLDGLVEGLAVIGPDGLLKYVNRAFHELWDTDRDSIRLEMHVADLCDLCGHMTLETGVWDRLVTFATGERNRRAWTMRITLGSGRTLSARIAPLPDGSTMAVFADASDSERIALALQERNEALEAAEQMRTALLDQISHRLRTPLNTILGFGQLLSDPRNGALAERQEAYVSGILEAGSHLLDTINEVTELASLQIDPLEGELGSPAVEEVLDTVRQLLEKRADEARVALVVEIRGAIGMLDCDPVRLRQIVFSLAADAILRCEWGDTVRLGAERPDSGAVAIFTCETAVGANPVQRLEFNSPTLGLVRRLVAAESGTVAVQPDPDANTLCVVCHFPEPSEDDASEASGAASSSVAPETG